MHHRRLATLAAVGLLAPIAIGSSSAAAVEQDLVVSATSGAARSVIEVRSASCVDDLDGSIVRVLLARLRSGTGADEVLAGSASALGNEAARVVVPDWIDPADPAVLEAACFELDLSVDDEDGVIEGVPTDFDPVPFDVLDPVDPAVQTRSLSRTSLLAGQGFELQGTGCFLPGSLRVAGVDLVEGGDLSGRSDGAFVVTGGDEIGADDFTVPALLANGGTFAAWSRSGDQRPVIDELREDPTNIPAGTYSAFPYCAALSEDGVTYLMFPPEQVEVTGSAPVGDLDLTVADNGRDVELAGGSCTAGDVEGALSGIDIDDDPFELARTTANARTLGSPLRPGLPRPGAGGRPDESALRAIGGDDEETSFATTPADDGTWAYGDVAAFDLGIVQAFAFCGDPFGDGWLYDPQVAAVDVTPIIVDLPPETRPIPTTPTAPTGPAPATPVPGSPAYAG
jgi:hypothetical protein